MSNSKYSSVLYYYRDIRKLYHGHIVLFLGFHVCIFFCNTVQSLPRFLLFYPSYQTEYMPALPL